MTSRLPVARRRTLLLAVSGLGVVIAIAALLVLTAKRKPSGLGSVVCYAQPDFRSRSVVVASDARDPAIVCADAWIKAGLGRPPRDLEACNASGGAIAVVPGSGREACALVGPSVYSGGRYFARGARRVTLLQTALGARAFDRCLGWREARDLARKELAERRLGPWRVLDVEATPAAPCAGFAVDGARKRVTLVPRTRV